MELNAASMMKYRLRFQIRGNGREWEPLSLCYLEQTSNPKSITKAEMEYRTS